ncbi:glycosyltransferase family 4 protein [bacterium]
MKVLQVNKFYFPFAGSERVMFETMKLLRSHGHEVAPFAIRDERNLDSEYSDLFPAGLDLKSAEGFSFSRKLAAAFRFVSFRQAYLNVRQVSDSFQPDIAHLHNIYHHLSPSVAAGLKSKSVPVVMTLHDFKLVCPTYSLYRNGNICEECSGGRFYSAVRNRCVRGSLVGSLTCAVEGYIHNLTRAYRNNVNLFISPSRLLKEKFVQMGFPGDRIRVLPNFVQTAPVESRGEESVENKHILFMGRLHPTKGADVLIKAVKMIDDDTLKLVIAGTGEEEKQLRSLAEPLSGDRIVFAGFKTGDDLKGLIREARFGVVPSTWYENCPMVTLEFWGSKKAVVASDLGGLSEMISHNEDGLLVEHGNPEKLAGTIKILLDDPRKAAIMGEKGFEKIKTKFSPESHYRGLIEIYEEAADLA